MLARGALSLAGAAGSGADRQPEKALVSPTHLPCKLRGPEPCQGVGAAAGFRKTRADRPRVNVPKKKSIGCRVVMDVTNIELRIL